MNKRKYKISALLILLMLTASCESVREYQKMYLNDKDMDISGDKLEGFETSWENYREGASGGNGSKSGGGCGCN